MFPFAGCVETRRNFWPLDAEMRICRANQINSLLPCPSPFVCCRLQYPLKKRHLYNIYLHSTAVVYKDYLLMEFRTPFHSMQFCSVQRIQYTVYVSLSLTLTLFGFTLLDYFLCAFLKSCNFCSLL